MNNNFSFRRGWLQLRSMDMPSVKEKIQRQLAVGDASFYKRLRGEVEPKVSEAEAIEKIFAEYGIKDVWGNA